MYKRQGYTKLFADIVTSTIWQEPAGCRVLWITILALKGKDQICSATVPSLANLSGISIEDCEAYLDKFQSPDKHSRSQEDAGRRIRKTEDGWLVLNGEKYQDKLSKEDRKEQLRKAAQRFRDKSKALDVERRAMERAEGKTIRVEHRDDSQPARA